MRTFIPLLTDEERLQLSQPERVNIGSYHTWHPVRECAFVVELVAQPLVTLADAAATGRRVYEFMSIHRAGDVLHYLLVRLTDIDKGVTESIAARFRNGDLSNARGELPIVDVDRCLHWDFDDTPPHHLAWLRHRGGAYWPRKLSELLDVVRSAQARLRGYQDYLLQHELRLIETGQHRRDFLADIERNPRLETGLGDESPLPQPLFEAIVELICRDDVRSVSCPFGDYALWRVLVEQQVRRAEASGLALQEAFCLCGPDCGLPDFNAADWGGEIHIPYEGACGADLFILPAWHRFSADEVRDGGKLHWAVSKPCHHILLQGDHGELACATRKVFGGWTLYTSTAPYEDCNPFIDRKFEHSLGGVNHDVGLEQER